MLKVERSTALTVTLDLHLSNAEQALGVCVQDHLCVVRRPPVSHVTLPSFPHGLFHSSLCLTFVYVCVRVGSLIPSLSHSCIPSHHIQFRTEKVLIVPVRHGKLFMK